MMIGAVLSAIALTPCEQPRFTFLPIIDKIDAGTEAQLHIGVVREDFLLPAFSDGATYPARCY